MKTSNSNGPCFCVLSLVSTKQIYHDTRSHDTRSHEAKKLVSTTTQEASNCVEKCVNISILLL